MPISHAVPSSTTGPSSHATRTFAARTPSASTRKTSLGRQLLQLSELLVRDEAVDSFGAKPGREAVEPRTLGLGEQRSSQVDPHLANAISSFAGRGERAA